MWLDDDLSIAVPHTVNGSNQTQLSVASDAAIPQQQSPEETAALRLLAIIRLLDQAQLTGRSPVSFAVICKRLALRMSSLQRLMTSLSTQGLVDIRQDPTRQLAQLTAAGQAIAQAIADAIPPDMAQTTPDEIKQASPQAATNTF